MIEQLNQVIENVNSQLCEFKVTDAHVAQVINSRESIKHMMRTLSSVISDSESHAQHVFVYLAQCNKSELTLVQAANVINHHTICQSQYLMIALRALEVITYDKFTQTMKVNFDNEIAKALYENARFILEQKDKKAIKQLNQHYRHYKLI